MSHQECPESLHFPGNLQQGPNYLQRLRSAKVTAAKLLPGLRLAAVDRTALRDFGWSAKQRPDSSWLEFRPSGHDTWRPLDYPGTQQNMTLRTAVFAVAGKAVHDCEAGAGLSLGLKRVNIHQAGWFSFPESSCLLTIP